MIPLAPSPPPLRRLPRRAALRPLRPPRLRRTTARPGPCRARRRPPLRRTTALLRPARPARRLARRRSNKPAFREAVVSSLPAGSTRPGRIARASRPGRVSSGFQEADMTVSVRDARDTERDRLWIQSVYRDYLDDLAPATETGTFPALGEVGHREPDQLFHWFADPNRFPLVILQSSEPVGFALVVRDSMTRTPSERPAAAASPPHATAASTTLRAAIDYRMAEFFITRARRRLGIGATAVRLIFSRFAGRWEITEYLRNTNAVSFWRRVVASYTRGNYRERIVNGEVRQTFESGAG